MTNLVFRNTDPPIKIKESSLNSSLMKAVEAIKEARLSAAINGDSNLVDMLMKVEQSAKEAMVYFIRVY